MHVPPTTTLALSLAIGLLASATVHAGSETPPRTIEVTPKKAGAGKLVYQRCAPCHGSEAEGRVGIAPRLASKTFLQAASDAMLVATISNGRAGTTMIPWGAAMKAAEMEQVIAWLRYETPTEPVKLDESPVRGSAKEGEKLYRDICAMCHGRSGAGYQESGSGTGIGRAAFLDTVSDGFLRFIIKNGKSDTGMRPFSRKSFAAVANLTDQQIEDVISYLRRAAW